LSGSLQEGIKMHRIINGIRGVGKSEQTRQNLGLSNNEFLKRVEIQNLESFINGAELRIMKLGYKRREIMRISEYMPHQNLLNALDNDLKIENESLTKKRTRLQVLMNLPKDEYFYDVGTKDPAGNSTGNE
jgi:hypothetical protein